jgi:CYTH domain-containing protein
MGGDGLEIERKYLLDGAPSAAELAALGARETRLEQVYLLRADDWVRRVRRIEAEGQSRHVLTRKRDRSGIVREEIEVDLSPEEYGRLAAEADPARRVIRKVRHVIPYGRWTLELDVFSEPAGLVLLEVELDHPDETPELPPSIAARVVREVSTEPAYANYRLALRAGAAPSDPAPDPVASASEADPSAPASEAGGPESA